MDIIISKEIYTFEPYLSIGFSDNNFNMKILNDRLSFEDTLSKDRTNNHYLIRASLGFNKKISNLIVASEIESGTNVFDINVLAKIGFIL